MGLERLVFGVELLDLSHLLHLDCLLYVDLLFEIRVHFKLFLNSLVHALHLLQEVCDPVHSLVLLFFHQVDLLPVLMTNHLLL